MTLKSLFKRPETIRYPYETKPPVEDLKGHVEDRKSTRLNSSH